MLEKIKERTSKYGISVRQTSNGYYEARTSIKLGGGNSQRLQKGGKTEESSILSLLTQLEEYLDNSYRNGLIICKLEDIIAQRLAQSINDMGIISAEITEKVLLVANKINTINAQILNTIRLQNNIMQYTNVNQTMQVVNNSVLPKENIQSALCIAEDIFKEWLKYRFSLCVKTDYNPKTLCRKTIEANQKHIDDIILPYMKKHNKIYLKDLTIDFIGELLKTVNGANAKRKVHITLDLIFQYAMKKKIVNDNPMKYIDRPAQPKKDEQKKKNDYIKSDEIDHWLDIFEQENTDMSILFETMLLAGLRPEEACGLKWTSLNAEEGFLDISNAYKTFIVYDEDMNPIGYERHDDKLKTAKSYRKVPLDPRLSKVLLKHKERQQEIFRTSRALKDKKRKWSESEYMFLGRTYQPYVSDTLSSAMPKLRQKYNLTKNVTPYGLRYSYCSYWAEMGLDKVSLMRAAGHEQFSTTESHYIRISPEHIKEEMERLKNVG